MASDKGTLRIGSFSIKPDRSSCKSRLNGTWNDRGLFLIWWYISIGLWFFVTALPMNGGYPIRTQNMVAPNTKQSARRPSWTSPAHTSGIMNDVCRRNPSFLFSLQLRCRCQQWHILYHYHPSHPGEYLMANNKFYRVSAKPLTSVLLQLMSDAPSSHFGWCYFCVNSPDHAEYTDTVSQVADA